ncbi:galactokinase [Capsulimonas corticalis]|uniref:Galactokinase n=1 Tax=Capsulimonas corticalis TaxID=2219043 RepID=A0A402CSH2_9BACT|nr:GHMP kinase [Capsulimonas corticalis]BDI31081.1 galactokinase [Capsulimonas corticalis]
MQDVSDFTERMRQDTAWRSFLSDQAPDSAVTVTRAPGRIDVMGGVADYSGALVAQATIGEAAIVALTRRTDQIVRIWSVADEGDARPIAEISLDSFSHEGSLRDYSAIRADFQADRDAHWASYVAGCFFVLLAERIAPRFDSGANILLRSDVPAGAGVSSSAAIEVATMQAIGAAYELNFDGVTLASLCQIVENRVVGAPCGVMDQMTSTLGTAGELLLLLCRPYEVHGTKPLPPDVRIYGVNSRIRHSVGGDAYTRARVAAFMGRKLLGVEYLAAIAPKVYRSDHMDRIPETVTGASFLAQYGETDDSVTRIDPETIYPVRAATSHAVFENERVECFVELLSRTEQMASAMNQAGSLMYGSHWSFGQIGLGCPETDLLVNLARDAGASKGVYGAKITGGGCGGTVALLTYGDDGVEAVEEIAARYLAQTGLTAQVFLAGASPGAAAFGPRTISRDLEEN